MSFENFLYVKTLDLRIVSHGGVGSVYLTDYLNTKLKVKTNQTKYNETCHSPFPVDVPTIFIYGDYQNAIISMYQRGMLNVNATKMHLDRDYDYKSLEWFIENYPKDPIGIKKIRLLYFNRACCTVLKYPFTKETVHKTLGSLGFDIDCSDIKIKPRKAHFITQILKIYES